MLTPQKGYCLVRAKWAIWLNSGHNVELLPHYRIVSHSALLHSACILSESSHSSRGISASWVWSPLNDTWKHTHVFRKSDLQRFLAVGGEWAAVFVLQIIFLMGFSKSSRCSQEIFEILSNKFCPEWQLVMTCIGNIRHSSILFLMRFSRSFSWWGILWERFVSSWFGGPFSRG